MVRFYRKERRQFKGICLPWQLIRENVCYVNAEEGEVSEAAERSDGR